LKNKKINANTTKLTKKLEWKKGRKIAIHTLWLEPNEKVRCFFINLFTI